MLYVFYGGEESEARKTALSYAEDLKAKEDITERIEGENYLPGQLATLANTNSLFGGARVYLIDNPSSESDLWDDLLQNLPLLADAEHHFIVLEKNLTAPSKKQFSKYAVSVTEYKTTKNQEFNPFSLAEALARRDRKALWLGLVKSSQLGLPPEETIGILWWQLKILRLASLTRSAEEAGVKDYPYNKAKRALPLFKPGELEKLSSSLLQLYHEGHRGLCDMDLALEEWVLRG